jgi:hypothetical protein
MELSIYFQCVHIVCRVCIVVLNVRVAVSLHCALGLNRALATLIRNAILFLSHMH